PTGVAVEADVGGGVANGVDFPAHDAGNVDVGAGGDLTDDVDQSGGHNGLHRNAGIGVDSQDLVENRIGYSVADLVGMAFGDRFGGKAVCCWDHSGDPSPSIDEEGGDSQVRPATASHSPWATSSLLPSALA